MILIADSGSTKTDWRVILPDQKIEQFRTKGINPYFQDEREISLHLERHVLTKPGIDKSTPKEIYFYGAGCSTDKNIQIVHKAFQSLFPKAAIAIESDLLAAARALCGQEEGIACILGTGANACLFDGEEITVKTPNFGFWLGDEGSGAYLGKQLILAYLHRKLPEELHQKLEKRYLINAEIILENTYQKADPNKYYATFSKFIKDHLAEPFIAQLVYEAFQLFMNQYVSTIPKFQQYKIHFLGSVAFHYQHILNKVVREKGLIMGRIMEKAIAGLTLYHQNNK